MNCFLYCRKSTEDKNRQVQSIADQKKIMQEIAHNRGLKIKEIFVDEKSAGKPYQRLAFQDMIRRIHQGEASIILSWKIDRISRNPVENGQISWMLQNNIIKEIITAERSYLPQDNVLLYMVESAMANQFLRDLSKNVKRGMNSLVEKGIYPGKAPLGYLNQGSKKGEKTIVPDPHYFPIIQELWKILLTEQHNLAEVYRIMKKKYPLYRKGKLLAFSCFYRMFHNQFYCGIFKWSDERHLGIHKKMITQSEYKRAQDFMHKKEKTRQRDLEFEYKGVFTCGFCQAQITAERKTKFVARTKSHHSYDYYRCVHRKRDIECKEKPLSKKAIESQLTAEIERVYLPKEVFDFGIDKLGEQKGQKTQLQATTSFNLQREIQVLTQQKNKIEDNLVLEADSEVRHIMKRKYEELKIRIEKLRENYDTLQDEIANNNLHIIQTLEVMKNAVKVMELGTKDHKKDVLHKLGSNWKIKGKKIDYKPHFVVEAVIKTKEFLRKKRGLSELTKSDSQTVITLADEEVSFVWYTLWEFIRNLQK